MIIAKWIQTFTGLAVYPLDLKAEQVCIEDIAHALSLICRFGGHCNKFYSVADHSVHVANLVPKQLRPYALIHDAAEVYIGDIVSPLKNAVCFNGRPAYIVEDAIHSMIIQSLGLSHNDYRNNRAIIKHADLTIFAAESRDLMKPHPMPWIKLPSPKLVERIIPLSSREAKASFLHMWNECSRRSATTTSTNRSGPSSAIESIGPKYYIT